MPRRSLDDEIDRLYQLPLNEFTSGRNALAKEGGGQDGQRIRALVKPSSSAWAVNQLYWRERNTYDTLVEASRRLRAAHRAVLGGRKADLRQADADHRAAVKSALTATLRLASDAGQKISDATHTEISQTLERLPADESPGRLTRALRPEGFEALEGMPIRPSTLKLVPPPAEARPRETREDKAAGARAKQDARRALQAARDAEKQRRAEVTRLEKHAAAAEREALAAKEAYERAEDAERKAKSALRDARDALEASSRAVRDAEARADE